jgi:LPS-assembly lipoprotein
MWSPNRRMILALPVALAACGFSPAFGPSGPSTGLMGTVALQDTTTRNGFDFIKRIEERLGRANAARYDLVYVIKTEKISLGITPDGAITRYNLLGSIAWTLSARDGGAVLATGVEQNFTAWSATGVTIAAVNAETDAGARLMRMLADQIVARLIALSPQLVANQTAGE